jgi:uncharacterized Zn-finger protein
MYVIFVREIIQVVKVYVIIKHKNILSDDITIETPKSTPQNSVPNFIDTSKFYCEYCKKELSRKDNLKRHYSICELKNKYEKKLEEENNKLKHENEELKKMMMELINKNCKVHPKTLEKINKNLGNGNSVVNGDHNNITTNSMNNSQNTINVIGLGNEDLTNILTEKQQLKVLREKHMCLDYLIKFVHFNDDYPQFIELVRKK